jgi:acylphosphatase
VAGNPGRSSTVRRRVVVRGRVQGVFFRDTCRREARFRGVTGWVSNAEDGSVEAAFEGEPAAVEAMIDWSHRGPEGAEVTAVEVVDEPPQGDTRFRVT